MAHVEDCQHELSYTLFIQSEHDTLKGTVRNGMITKQTSAFIPLAIGCDADNRIHNECMQLQSLNEDF